MEISNLYSTSTILVEYERTTKKVPTMKPLDADKKASKTSEAAPAAKVAERVDFSNVKIEPIFEEMVDFDTFAKRREHITYQDDMPLSQSIFQASKRFSKLPMISR